MLPGHRVLQGHVLGSCEGQSVSAVVVHQFGDAGKDAAALVQRVAQALAAFSLCHDDVHTALTGPNGAGQRLDLNTCRFAHFIKLQILIFDQLIKFPMSF